MMRELWNKWALDEVVGGLPPDLFPGIVEEVVHGGVLSPVAVVEEFQLLQLLAAVCEDPLLLRWSQCLLFRVLSLSLDLVHDGCP